ncbi:hypothetical protein ACSEV1_28490 [Pseudomonas aeruginosa]
MQRLIQFVLRGRDELSPAAQQSTEALEGLRTTAANLNRQLDDAKGARGLVTALGTTERAIAQTQRRCSGWTVPLRTCARRWTATPGAGAWPCPCRSRSGTQRVSVQVRRAGTAGEESAPDVMEDWMTGTEVARSRGICELSKGGNQAIETRRIPLFQKDDGVPGLVQPGMLVEVIDVDEGAGTCRVRLRNNVVIAARGTAVPAGQMAFISDGLVTGPAPQLPQFDIEV